VWLPERVSRVGNNLSGAGSVIGNRDCGSRVPCDTKSCLPSGNQSYTPIPFGAVSGSSSRLSADHSLGALGDIQICGNIRSG
jgi:hypothetical protein